jgi:hypothetical protein
LYAPESVQTCPNFVMATLAELAEHGIAGSADVLPVPVGTATLVPESPARTMLDHAREALNARMTKDDLRLVLDNTITYAAALETRAARYRIAWGTARTRAISTGGAADRYAARARAAQEALQHMLFTVIAGQMALKVATDEAAELRARLAEYERPADEGPVRYALTGAAEELRSCCAGPECTCTPSSPQDDQYIPPREDDVRPQVNKLRAILAGQREQAPDMPYRAVRGSIELGSYATEGAAREACETVARQIWPNGEPRWISAADEPEEMHAGSVAELDISIDRRVRQTCIAVKRAAETGGA